MTKEQFNSLIIASDTIYTNIFGVLNEENLNDLYENYVRKNLLFENYFSRLVEIKFLAIAEASTEINSTYFYSTIALNNTPWFSVPLQRFSANNPFFGNKTEQNKSNALNNLSTEGFLLVDISPAAFAIVGINRNQRRFKKLINFLLEKYFFEYVIPTISLKLSEDAKYILMGTMVTDRIVYDFVLNEKKSIINLKDSGVFEGFERYSMSSACATNGPILRFFNCALMD